MALAVAGLAFASRYLLITNHVVLFTTALSPYLMPCTPLSVVLPALGRHWMPAAVAVALTMATLAAQLPGHRASGAARFTSVGLRIVSADLFVGQADPSHLVRSARERADVLAYRN